MKEEVEENATIFKKGKLNKSKLIEIQLMSSEKYKYNQGRSVPYLHQQQGEIYQTPSIQKSAIKPRIVHH